MLCELSLSRRAQISQWSLYLCFLLSVVVNVISVAIAILDLLSVLDILLDILADRHGRTLTLLRLMVPQIGIVVTGVWRTYGARAAYSGR